MNDNKSVPNEALREHVTGHSFVLSLRKTHIWTLAAIANNDRSMAERRESVPDYFVTAVKALGRRGLIGHKHRPNFAGHNDHTNLNDYYRLTKAGWAVYDLLVEAGMAEHINRKSKLRKVA